MRLVCFCVLIAVASVLASCGDSGSGEGDASEPVLSAGCDSGSVDQSVEHVDLQFGGEARSYELHVPPSYDGGDPVPLLLNFHGFTSNGPQQAAFSDMNATADERGAIVAYPNGLNSSWNAGACCGISLDEDVDDVGFARAVVEDLADSACIDLSRVYATGMSNGGFMSHRLACEASDIIAAIAPVAGVLGLDPAECNPGRAVPIIHLHGTADPLVGYDGGGLAPFIGAPDSHSGWVARNGCTGASSVTFQNGVATCETVDECDGGASVTLCTLDGIGHCWPGQEFCPDIGVDLGDSTTDISANEVMWDLFDTVRLTN